VREGLKAVKEELGPQALVLSTHGVGARMARMDRLREVEIVAAVDRELSASRRVESVERQSRPDRSDRPRVEDEAAAVAARLTAAGLDGDTAAEVAASMPSSSRRGASLHSLRTALAARLSSLATPDEGYARVEVFIVLRGRARPRRSRRSRRRSARAADVASDWWPPMDFGSVRWSSSARMRRS